MELSVAYSFQPGLLQRLAAVPEVTEVYAKLDADPVGGGRSSYTFRPVGRRGVERAVREATRRGIRFNYLLNGATLGGMEQTRRGQRKLRSLIDWVAASGATAVTVASPYLLRLVKKMYPELAVRIGVFAVVDNPVKAREWVAMGADAICVSAIGCNRNRRRLEEIRKAVSCKLQLIVNASCLLHCTHELTHMNLLTESSRSSGGRGGFCMDYCFLHCSRRRLEEPVNYLRATWIRPEDLHLYEEMGYDSFKLVERSCSADLMMTRVTAYARRSWEGNLLDIVGPVAQISRSQDQTLLQRLFMFKRFFRPDMVKLSSMLAMKQYAETILVPAERGYMRPVMVDNRALEGFAEEMLSRDCDTLSCASCGLCEKWTDKAVTIDPVYRKEALARANRLDAGLLEGSHW